MRWKIASLLVVAAILTAPAVRAQQAAQGEWVVRFFHDEDDSGFYINDLKFPSPQRGIACGYLVEKGRVRPRVLVTSDGGESWSFVETRRVGLSLFFLNDTLGWMVSDGAIWRTVESGRSWERVSRLNYADRVHFLSETHGFAVGTRKSMYETKDGGKTWEKLPAAAEPKADAEYTAYGWIEFRDANVGAIVGWNRPPRPGSERPPDWMDPEAAGNRRQWPTTSILLQTIDGGQTWETSTTSMFGRIIRLRQRPDGTGLALVWFDDVFDWPSEVHLLTGGAERSTRVFRAPDRAVTDALLVGDRGYLAAVEPPGKFPKVLVPGRVVVLESADLRNWTEMPVDYRAFAQRVVLASAGPDSVWMATDTGMILQLRTGP